MNNCGRLFVPSEQFEADSSLTTIRISSYISAMFEDSALRLRIYMKSFARVRHQLLPRLRVWSAPLQQECEKYRTLPTNMEIPKVSSVFVIDFDFPKEWLFGRSS